MKKFFYFVVFFVCICCVVITVKRINKVLVANEELIKKYFIDIKPDDFLNTSEIDYDVQYEKNTDIRQLSNTQNVRTMLEALNVSSFDIEKIGKMIDIDKLIIKQREYVRMVYQDDIDFNISSETILPPHIKESDFVRNIRYLSFPIGSTRYTFVKENEDFTLTTHAIENKTSLAYVNGKIDGSLYDSFINKNISYDIFQTFVNIYSFDIDFQRDIRKGDQFEIVHDKIINDEGVTVGIGRVLYAKLTLSKGGKALEYFILNRDKGSKTYYDRNGKAVLKTFMKTPVNGARVSSRYGLRKHPILGYSRLHAGVDFAAPMGTAIYAAADGQITFMGWNGGRKIGYGQYTVIRHNNTYSTAYAHQSRFHPKLKQGSFVKQGQVIGYVGSTGYSTGAHLHYEVIKNGTKINPATITSLSRNVVTGKDKAKLLANIQMIDNFIRTQKKR